MAFKARTPLSASRSGRAARDGWVGLISLAGAVCIGGGLVTPVAGFVLVIIHSAIPADVLLGQIGTIFIFVAIPLLLIGSHLMDLIESRDAARKAADTSKKRNLRS